MSKHTRRSLEVVLLILVLLAALGRLPSYSYVRMSGPEGTTVIKSCGPGPHLVQVTGPDGCVARSGVW